MQRRLYILIPLLLLFTACEQLGGAGLQQGDTTPPEGFVRVGESFGAYEGDSEREPIEDAFDNRIVRVEPGGVFYLQLAFEDEGDAVPGEGNGPGSGLAEYDVRLVNDTPGGVAGVLDPAQGFFTLGQPTGISEPVGECQLVEFNAVSCVYEVRVSEDAVNIDQLEGSGDAFAYIFSAQATDGAGNTAAAFSRGYVIVGDDTVEIPDAVLEQAIRDEVGKPTGDLTIGELRSITSLTYSGVEGRRIESLEGLQFAENLVELIVPDNRIADFTPLSGTELESIDVSGNGLSSLIPLLDVGFRFTGLTVTSVKFEDNQVSDLTPLNEFPNLRAVIAGGNQIGSLAPLAERSLNVVDVPNNQIDDLSPLVSSRFIGDGDVIVLGGNPLDTCPGTEDRQAIETLLGRGAEVLFDEPESCGS